MREVPSTRVHASHQLKGREPQGLATARRRPARVAG
jgi:hypothetical protein